MYRHFFKRMFDIVLSLCGIIVLALPMLVIGLIVKSDDRGTAVFKQKRVGKKKNGELTYFYLYKFRSMKMSAPHDVPTHLLENPEQYTTRVGGFLRTTGGDELLQLFLILSGKMSIVGPRPALWNQFDLIELRERYGANDIKPGLTGWAQVNGRNELEVDEKARLDGEYAQMLEKNGFRTDWRCFWRTFGYMLRHGDEIKSRKPDENR